MSTSTNNTEGGSMGEDRSENFYSMIRTLCAQKSGLKIRHLNTQSLHNGLKLEEFRYLFVGPQADVECVSETWFYSDIEYKFYDMAGFKVFRGDRMGLVGGGSAIYVREGIQDNIDNKPVSGFSRHDMIYLTLNYENRRKEIRYQFRDYKNLNHLEHAIR